jgi:hypothetical protein
MLVREIAVGYVSTRKNARLHLDRDGIAPCGSGSQRITLFTTIDTDHASRVCRRCAKAIRNQLARVLSRQQSRPAAIRDLPLVTAITAAMDTLTTARERNEINSIREGIRAILAAPQHSDTTTTTAPVDGDPTLF